MKKIMEHKGLVILILVIALLVFLATFFNESEDKFITEINYNQLVAKINKEEDFILYVKKQDCSFCEEFNPTFLSVLRKYNLQAYSIYTDKLEDTDSTSFDELVNVTGTPTVLFFNKGKETMYRLEGNREKDAVIKVIKNAGFITE